MVNFLVGFLAGGIFTGIEILVAWHASFKNFAFGQIVENTDLNFCPKCEEQQSANKNYCEICGCKIK